MALNPLGPAPHHAKGLVAECRGDYKLAAEHLQRTVFLLQLTENGSGALMQPSNYIPRPRVHMQTIAYCRAA